MTDTETNANARSSAHTSTPHIHAYGTGLNGLVGSKIVTELEERVDFDNLDISDPKRPVDITDAEQVLRVTAEPERRFLLHSAAFTNVNAAWEQRGDKDGLAWQVNVEGTRNIVDACQENGLHLIHLSTAFVFDGEKDGMYTEDDPMNPIEWYGRTKAEAETVIRESSIDWTILRIDFPFRQDSFERPDVAHTIAQKLQADELYPMFTNHWFGPTVIEDLAQVVGWVMDSETTGLFHASSGEKWTDYEFATAIKAAHDLDGEIEQGDLDAYLETLQRPYQRNTAMNTGKLDEMVSDAALNRTTTIHAIQGLKLAT
jgi:dTDP-4-dehydrorhamnose reductase